MEFDRNTPRPDLAFLYCAFFDGLLRPKGADTPAVFHDRVMEGFNDIPEGTSVLFCHSGILKLFLKFFGFKIQYLGNLGMIMIEYDDILLDMDCVAKFNGYHHPKL